MKKSEIFSIIVFALSATGCLKDKPNVDFSNIAPIAEISSSNINPTKNGPSSGLDYFNQATLPYIGADTTFDVTFNVNITGEYPPAKDVTVTLAVDDAKRVAYNSNLAPADQFILPADSNYSFPVKTAVIKAGTRLATFTVTFLPQTLDPSKSYMLPITLTDASGLTISGNLSTIYLHIIGNPLAGVYNWDFTRYNEATATGTPNTSPVPGATTTFVPIDATTIEVGSNYAAGYVLNFTNNNGVLSDFKVSFSKATLDDLTASGIVVTGGPTIITADPVSNIFEFTYSVTNASGAPRLLIDKYYK
jgi:hypothetical protein